MLKRTFNISGVKATLQNCLSIVKWKGCSCQNNTEESEMRNKYFSSGTVKKPDVVISFEDRDETLHLKQQRQHVPSTNYLVCVFYFKMHVGMLVKKRA